MNIRLFKPSLTDAELQAVKEAFDRSWIGLGPKVAEFEEAWKNHIGCEAAVGLNSATAALHLAIRVFGFERGKKVLVPSMTFSATASAVLYEGLIPVFVDSDPVTLGMCLEDLDKKYDKDCVAVIPVHYCGHPVPMEKLVPWARERNLKVIEDCAHTTGSLYEGKPLGTWGDIGCYSFEEKKLMTTGDGGMIVTNDPELFKDIKAMRWVGIDKDNWRTAQSYVDVNKDAYHWFYELSVLGYKYNMNDLAASIGLVQLNRLPAMNQQRSKFLKQYLTGLDGLDGLKPVLPYEPDKYAYQMFAIRSRDKENLILHLKSKGIATGCHYTPLTMQPLFAPFASECRVAELSYRELITLPFHAELGKAQVNWVIDNILKWTD